MSERNDRKRRNRAKPPTQAVLTLQELFPDWSVDDLNTALGDSGNDIELCAQRIFSGELQAWGQVKTRKELKNERDEREKVERTNRTEHSVQQVQAKAQALEQKHVRKSTQHPKPDAVEAAAGQINGKDASIKADKPKKRRERKPKDAKPVAKEPAKQTDPAKMTWAQILAQKSTPAAQTAQSVPPSLAEADVDAVEPVSQDNIIEAEHVLESVAQPVELAPHHREKQSPEPTPEPESASKAAKPVPLIPTFPPKAGESLSWATLLSSRDEPKPAQARPAQAKQAQQGQQSPAAPVDKPSERSERERKPRRQRKKKDLAEQVSDVTLESDAATAAAPQHAQAFEIAAGQPGQAQAAPQHAPYAAIAPQGVETPGVPGVQVPQGAKGVHDGTPGAPQGMFDYPQYYQTQPYPYPQQYPQQRYQGEQYQFDYDLYKQQEPQAQTQSPAAGHAATSQSQFQQHPYFMNPAYAYYYQNFGYNQQYPGAPPAPKNYQPFYNYRGSPQPQAQAPQGQHGQQAQHQQAHHAQHGQQAPGQHVQAHGQAQQAQHPQAQQGHPVQIPNLYGYEQYQPATPRQRWD